jgi:hypothetical protein
MHSVLHRKLQMSESLFARLTIRALFAQPVHRGQYLFLSIRHCGVVKTILRYGNRRTSG